MSFESEIKRLATVWNNTGSSHSDDLLDELKDILKTELGFEPKEYPYGTKYDDMLDDINKEFNN